MFDIKFQVGVAEIPSGPLDALLPNLAATVERSANLAQLRWMDYARGAPLPDGRKIPNRTGDYLRSIRTQQVSPFHWRVESASPEAEGIERGKGGYDMKRMLRTSLKVRVSKTGNRYMIIPFRHGSPGTSGFKSVMTLTVHELAKALLPSKVSGTAMRDNQLGVRDIGSRKLVQVQRYKYRWGTALPEGLVGKLRESHATDPFAGMRRFDAAQGGHSKFLTFRVMSEKSTGWIRGATPGYFPARTVAQEIAPAFEAACKAAFTLDVEALMSAALGGPGGRVNVTSSISSS